MQPPPEPAKFFISGLPAPQGSKRHVGNGIVVESSKQVKPWRESIRATLTGDRGQPKIAYGGAVICGLEFVLKRPQSAPKRSTPPAIKRPDLDKLSRAVLDAITSAGVIGDDSQVIELWARKRLAEKGETPGLHLTVREA